MPPTLILIRHAQALHNVAGDWSLRDPPLTKLGEEQCKELQESLKKEELADKVELIVVSAMRRTLQTAKLGLTWLIEEKKIPVLPDAGWQGRLFRTHKAISPLRVTVPSSESNYAVASVRHIAKM
jgi:broad specificity phosphatase PhoE